MWLGLSRLTVSKSVLICFDKDILPMKIMKPAVPGFSLIEVMVVMIILAIVAVIAVPIYQGSLPDAYAPEAEAVLSAISTAAQRYGLEHADSFDNISFSELRKLGLDVDDNGNAGSTDKWTFTLSGSGSSFTAVANGKASVLNGALSGKSITMNYDINNNPHESRTYSGF